MKQSTFYYLLRRGAFGGGGLDSDYKAVLDVATGNGWSLPSDEQQLLHSTLIRQLKSCGAWAKMDRFFLHTNDADRNFSRIDWVDPATSQIAINGNGAGTLGWTSNEGFYTDGVSYVNYRYNPTTDGVNVSQNSMSVGMYEHTISASNAGLLIGSDDASNDVVLTANYGGNAFLALNDDSTGFTPSITYKAGLYMGVRNASNQLYFYDADGTQYADADPSTGLNSVDFSALKYGASLFSSNDVRAGLFFVGGEMSAEVGDVYNAVNQYFNAI